MHTTLAKLIHTYNTASHQLECSVINSLSILLLHSHKIQMHKSINIDNCNITGM